MKILGDVLKLAIQYLKERNLPNARRDAEELLSSILKMPRLNLYLQFDRPLHEDELVLFRTYLKRKVLGEPVEYICGKVFFSECEILVNPDVLIPRPETEILIEKVFGALQASPLSGRRALDLCCGSGYMGIALKKRFPELEVALSDLSDKALAVAAENARRNGQEVELFSGDLLAPFEGRKFDFVLCNPPYVSRKEFNELDSSVKNFEPQLALIGGEDGLLYYQRLGRDLPRHLTPGAQVFFEIGTGQGGAVLDLFNAGCWKTRRVEKDWAGHDRFFFLEFE